MQFDIFIPDLNLAIEYPIYVAISIHFELAIYYGPHHYRQVAYFGPRRHIIDRDTDKRLKCKNNNITLIEIPYWWDNKKV